MVIDVVYLLWDLMRLVVVFCNYYNFLVLVLMYDNDMYFVMMVLFCKDV